MITDPPGATLEVDGKSYVTPTNVVLKRNQPHMVTITKEGYQGLTFKLRANWDAGGAFAVVSDIVIPGGSRLYAAPVSSPARYAAPAEPTNRLAVASLVCAL